MQPQPIRVAPKGEAPEESTVEAARALWFRADFDACLAVLDRIGLSEGAERSEVILLRARALYRQRKFGEVEEYLRPLLGTFTLVDEACTARMLHATALARSGFADRGLALLERIAASADALDAHKAVRAEIAHSRALAHWIKRELPDAERFALEAEAAGADVISVRATQLRGFVALARQRYEHALSLFRRTLEAYRPCRERDTDLAEVTVYEIANLEQMLLSSRVHGTHDLAWGRLFQRPTGPLPHHKSVAAMQTAVFDAWLYAHNGDRANAFRMMRSAGRLAPNEYWTVWSLAERANLSHAFGNSDDAREHAVEAAEVAETLDWDRPTGEERIALLLLARALEPHDGFGAITLLRRYEALRSNLAADQVLKDDPRLAALENLVHGLACRVGGRANEARKHFEKAYRAFNGCGNLWYAVLALIELDSTPVPAGPRGDYYLETAALLIRENFPRSFLVRRLGRWMRAYDDPIVSGLTPAPRDILRRLLEGWVPKDIAASKGLAEGTVRNHVADLEAAFGVHSIQELLVACYQRGLGAARWSEDFDPTVPQTELRRVSGEWNETKPLPIATPRRTPKRKR
jgi:tetratricopeptide (TPR) repeat protein/DNA-binding CsgD family transcriptional regulator